MSATKQSSNINVANGNGVKNGSATNGSTKNCTSIGSPNGAPVLKRGFSAINANVHEMYVYSTSQLGLIRGHDFIGSNR